jgi:hypothetical protein
VEHEFDLKPGESRKFRKKPVVIEATQWFKNGDHPEDGTERFPTKAPTDGRETGAPTDPRYTGEFAGELFEGKVVRYFRRPDVPGETACKHCGRTMHIHGWIDTKEGGHIVCPGDWIITGVQGERYPCKPDIFIATYEAV